MTFSTEITEIIARTISYAKKEGLEYITPELLLFETCKEEAFIDAYNESEEDDETDYNEVFDKFINKHGFTHDLKTIYEYIVKGLTVQPFFQVIATDDEYGDSDSVLGPVGQEQLEALIDAL